jgi:prevent-host-death family protein
MSKVVNIHEAKTHLSRIVDEVARGTEVVIAKAGKPVARLVPVEASVRPKRYGLLKDKIQLPAAKDFNAGDEEVIALFEGR